MCTMLLSLTSLYEDADVKNHPRLCVIFNNVSKNAHPEKVVPEYGKGTTNTSDPKKEVKKQDKKNNAEVSDNDSIHTEEEKTGVTWEDFIKQYRTLLLEVLEEQYGQLFNKKEFLSERIKQLFPDSNFSFYQMREDEAEMK